MWLCILHAAQHRAIARKEVSQPKAVHGGLAGMELEKLKAIQRRIDDFTQRMSEMLCIERDSELEFTQQELDAVPHPTPNETTSDSPKPTEFLVSHGQAEQELCDTICNLTAVNTSTGLTHSLLTYYITFLTSPFFPRSFFISQFW